MINFLIDAMKQKEVIQKTKKVKNICYIKKGFSLISFLLYLLLFSIITGIICHIITTLIIPSIFSLKKTQSIISMHIASDFFVRDMKNIKNDGCTWKVILPLELIWHTKDYDVGWFFHQNSLQRTEGIYNGLWQNAKRSVIAKGIANATFTLEKTQDRVTGVELSLIPQSTSRKPIVCYVSLKNKEKREE